jgi:hypothetical protein
MNRFYCLLDSFDVNYQISLGKNNHNNVVQNFNLERNCNKSHSDKIIANYNRLKEDLS